MPRTRWLNPDEAAAWRAFLSMQWRLFSELDAQLRRDAGMSHDYYAMLVRLSEAPERSLRMSDLAESVGSSPSRVTHAVASLERLGWVERVPCPEDRRVHHARLTPEGMAALKDAAPGHVRCVREILFDRLTPRQVDALRHISEAITGASPTSADPGDPKRSRRAAR